LRAKKILSDRKDQKEEMLKELIEKDLDEKKKSSSDLNESYDEKFNQ